MYLNLFYTLYTRHFLPNQKVKLFISHPKTISIHEKSIPFLSTLFFSVISRPLPKKIYPIYLSNLSHTIIYTIHFHLYISLSSTPFSFIFQESIANSYQHTPSSHPLPYTVPIVSSIYSNSSYPNQPSFQTHPVWDDVISPWVHV